MDRFHLGLAIPVQCKPCLALFLCQITLFSLLPLFSPGHGGSDLKPPRPGAEGDLTRGRSCVAAGGRGWAGAGGGGRLPQASRFSLPPTRHRQPPGAALAGGLQGGLAPAVVPPGR